MNVFDSIFINNSADNSAVIGNNNGVVTVYSSVFYKNIGNSLIFSSGNSNLDLRDNFYFWVIDPNNPNSNDINTYIRNTITINTPSGPSHDGIGSYFYINLAYGKVLTDNILKLTYSMLYGGTPSGDGLTVTDITLKNKNINVPGFNYLANGDLYDIVVDGNNRVNLNYFDDTFHTLVYEGKTNTELTLVTGDISGNEGDVVELIAILKDSDNSPVVGAPVDFYVNGLYVGTNDTGNDGVVIFHYTLPAGLIATSYYAKYDGNVTHNQSMSNLAIITLFFDTQLSLVTGDISGNEGDVVVLKAILKDSDNNFVVGAPVDFYVDGSYVGTNSTGNDGVAIFHYTLPKGLNSNYHANYGGNVTYSQSVSSFAKIATMSSISQLVLSKDKDSYFVGDYITLTWSTTNITDGAVGTIYFYEDGKLQHSIQVRLSDGRIAYQFKKSHKSLNIVLCFAGDDNTRSSQSTVSTVVKDKYVLKAISSVLTVAKRGYINITVNDLDGKAVDGGYVTLQFDNYDVFKIPVVNGVARFSKVMMQAGNKRLLRISYVDSDNITRTNNKTNVPVNKGTPLMVLSLNPNTNTINKRVAITTTVNGGVIAREYNNIPYTIKFYSNGKLAHTINKKYNFNYNNGVNSFVYNFKRTHSNLIIVAILKQTHDYNGVNKKSTALTIT